MPCSAVSSTRRFQFSSTAAPILRRALLCACLFVLPLPAAFGSAPAQTTPVPFDSTRWELSGARISEFLGREALEGIALVKDLQFEDGVIEVDIAVPDTRVRSYPGIVFRRYSEGNFERLYIRPHRHTLYPDAIQYTPVFNGVEGWQLYNGEGYTAGAVVPEKQWNRLRLEVQGSRARMFWNDAPEPALVIRDLKHGVCKGGIGLYGPRNGTAYFSNFRCREDSTLVFPDLPAEEIPAGVVQDWELSRPFPAGKIDIELIPYPRFYTIFAAGWQPVTPEPSGLVNVSRTTPRTPEQPDLVLARKVFDSDRQREIKLTFGYSDEITLFLNGRRLFYGMSAYRWRDPSFLGIAGYNDVLYLPVEKGRNELFLMVKESFGGWGFLAKADPSLDPPKAEKGRLVSVWETPEVFLTPESVVYDPRRDLLYVTNFDNTADLKETDETKFTGFISKLRTDGEIVDLKWITGLHAPCGMAVRGDRLYTLERRWLTEIDTGSGKILKRRPIPDCDFPNDLAIGPQGEIYISDTSPSDVSAGRIYRFREGEFEVWVRAPEAYRPNGMFVDGNRLIFGGNPGDPFLKAIDLTTRRLEPIASLGAGVIDGIRPDGEGNYLVSHWEGMVYLVSPEGEVTELLNGIGEFNCADFEYIREQSLMIIPTFVKNRVSAYRYAD